MCHPCKDQRESQQPVPPPQCPDPVSFLYPDPLGLELLWPAARHLSASVSALLRSSCRAEHRSPGACTTPPARPPRLPSPDLRLSPRAVPAQPLLQATPAILPQPTAATATAPTPKSVDTPHRSPFSLQASHSSPGIVSCCPHQGSRGWTGSLAKGEPDPSTGSMEVGDQP